MSVENFSHHSGHGTTVRHCKQDSLDEREFELLLEGAKQMDGYKRTEAVFIIFAAGRLGLRRGEITHFVSDWVDHREKLLSVPGHQPCRKGRDGGMCGHCNQLVRQAARVNEIPAEEIADNWWRPKTSAAVRGIPFDWCARTELAIERFCDEFDSFDRSSTAISRRVKSAAQLAPGLSKEDVYPHALRATCATYQVSRGLGVHALTSMMGWADLQTAQVYISNSDENTRRAVRAAHNQ